MRGGGGGGEGGREGGKVAREGGGREIPIGMERGISHCVPTFIHISWQIYRLRGAAMPWAGRVEARIGGVWGTICDSQWDGLDGNVVCRSLGYGTAKAPLYGAQHGRGVGKIHLTEVK